MLVVWRVKIGDVGRENTRRVGRFELIGRAVLIKWVRQNVGDAEFDVLVGAGCPSFEVGHLYACGRIHPVCSFDQASKHDRFEFWSKIECFDVCAHRIDSSAVVWVEEAGVLAVGFGDESVIALRSCDGVEIIDDGGCLFDDLGGVCLYIAHGEIVGIGVVVVGVDAKACGFEGVADARGAAKEIDDRASSGGDGMAEIDDLIDEKTL